MKRTALVWLLAGLGAGCGQLDADALNPGQGAAEWAASGWGKGDIYGQDDRREIRDPGVEEVYREVGRSTALLVHALNLEPQDGGRVRLLARTMSENVQRDNGAPLCATERFGEDPAPGFCTGFLIAPDLVATAGHCVNGHTGCPQLAFAFGFAKPSPNEQGLVLPASDVYRCEAVVGHLYNPQEGGEGQMSSPELWQDWAVVRLDRPVTGRAPLGVTYGQGPALGDRITTVGHPSGLALKATQGRVQDASRTRWFNTDLDIYQGNSGSPAVDARGSVRGIVVRGTGGRSFVATPQGCLVSRACENYGDQGCTGNHVLRPEPLALFQRPDLALRSTHKPVNSGFIEGPWEESLVLGEGGTIGFVTLNLSVLSADPTRMVVELWRDGLPAVTLMDKPQGMSAGQARWSRTSFAFAGQEARGTWRVRVTDVGSPGGTTRVEWMQIVVGTVAQNTPGLEPSPSNPTSPLPGATQDPWIGVPCQRDADCAFVAEGRAALCHGPQGSPGFCTIPCQGYCPDRQGHPSTFCVAAPDAAQSGLCAVVPDPANSACGDVPGTTPAVRERFIGSSAARPASREVCAPL